MAFYFSLTRWSLFDATFITEAEIDAVRTGQVRGQTRHQKVVFGCHCALDTAARRRSVSTDTQAFLRGTLKKRVTDNHP